jgi:hypothetical protein
MVSGGNRVAGGTLMDTLRRFEGAHERRDLEEMRACFHNEALIESVASDAQPLGPDETTNALGDALRDGVYMIYGWQYEELSPDVVLSITRARHRVDGRAIRDETVYRLITGRDGLMWRVRLFRSRSSALEHLELNGPL